MKFIYFNYDGAELDAFESVEGVTIDDPFVILHEKGKIIAVIHLMPGQWVSR
jgi:hypothetical protein